MANEPSAVATRGERGPSRPRRLSASQIDALLRLRELAGRDRAAGAFATKAEIPAHGMTLLSLRRLGLVEVRKDTRNLGLKGWAWAITSLGRRQLDPVDESDVPETREFTDEGRGPAGRRPTAADVG